MLEVSQMARSSYYYHRKQCAAGDKYKYLRRRIVAIYNTHKGRYGYRRITAELNTKGVHVNHKTVARLMREMGLKARVKRIKYHSYKGSVGKIAPNVLHRNFVADKPNQKWVTDVTQVTINNKKCYLSPILDLYNGEIISFAISRQPDMHMVTYMLQKAFKAVKPTSGLILHSDQGYHYQNSKYSKFLANRGVIQSMSRKGNCLDNAAMESFFGIMKTELLYLQKFDSIEQFERELRKYIIYYNNKRIKLKLNGMSPVNYRVQQNKITKYKSV